MNPAMASRMCGGDSRREPRELFDGIGVAALVVVDEAMQGEYSLELCTLHYGIVRGERRRNVDEK